MFDSVTQTPTVQTPAAPVLTGPGGEPLQYWKGWAFFYNDQGKLVRVREADRPDEYHTSAEQPQGETEEAAQGDHPACTEADDPAASFHACLDALDRDEDDGADEDLFAEDALDDEDEWDEAEDWPSAEDGDAEWDERAADADESDPVFARLPYSATQAVALPLGPHGFTPERRVVFAEELAASGNVRRACAVAGVSRNTAYKARRRDPVLAQAWDAALTLAARHAGEVLAERALDGVEEPVFWHGEVVGTRRRYDTRLLLAHVARLDMLASRRPAALAAGRFDELLARLGGMEPAAELTALLPSVGDCPEIDSSQRVPGLALPRAEWCAHAVRHAEDDAMVQADAEGWSEAMWEERSPALHRAAGADAEARWDGHRAAACAYVDSLEAAAEEGLEPPMEYKSLDGPDGEWPEDLWPEEGAENRAPDCVTPVTPSRPAPGESGPSAVEQGQLDRAVPSGDEADLAGGGFGYVDQAATGEGAAIVDADHHRFAAFRVGHADFAAERQRAVGGGQFVGVEALAVRRAAPGQFVPVIAGHAGAQFGRFGFVRLGFERGAGQRFELGAAAGAFGERGGGLDIGEAERAMIFGVGRSGQARGGQSERADKGQQAREASCPMHCHVPSVR